MIYQAQPACRHRCELYVGDGGHRYYKERVWPFIAEAFGVYMNTAGETQNLALSARTWRTLICRLPRRISETTP